MPHTDGAIHKINAPVSGVQNLPFPVGGLAGSLARMPEPEVEFATFGFGGSATPTVIDDLIAALLVVF